MRKRLYPLLALLLGAAGLALRIWQLTRAIVLKTGLLLLHHSSTYSLIALTICGLLALFLCSATLSREAQDWRSAFRCTNMPLQLLSIVGGAGYGVASLLLLRELALAGLPYSLRENPFQGVFALLLLAACAAILSVVLRNGEKTELALAPVVPGFTSCIWLVLTYHTNASDPCVMAYLWQILAVIAVCLSWYYAAGFSFQHPRPRRTVFFHLTAGFLCILSLADPMELSQRVLFLTNALWFLSRAAVLIDNTRVSGKREE